MVDTEFTLLFHQATPTAWPSARSKKLDAAPVAKGKPKPVRRRQLNPEAGSSAYEPTHPMPLKPRRPEAPLPPGMYMFYLSPYITHTHVPTSKS